MNGQMRRLSRAFAFLVGRRSVDLPCQANHAWEELNGRQHVPGLCSERLETETVRLTPICVALFKGLKYDQ